MVDHADVRISIRRTLEEAGHRVLDAADGELALRLLETTPIDVVITDLFMPGEDGIVLMRRIRKDFPAVKVIAISGGGFGGKLDLLKDAVLLGASSALRKPFTQDQLLGALEAALR